MRRSAVLLIERFDKGILPEKAKAKIFSAADLVKGKVKDVKEVTGMNQKADSGSPPQNETIEKDLGFGEGWSYHGQNIGKDIDHGQIAEDSSERNQWNASRGEEIKRSAESDMKKSLAETPNKEPLKRPV